MNDNKREQQLGLLFDASIQDLLTRVQSGEATAQDYKNIIQLLRDNGITCELRKGSPMAKLAESLPFTTADFESRTH